jgi:hypothetical protein
MSTWIAAIAAFALAGVGFGLRSAKTKISLSALQKREALSDDEIYQRFYVSSGLDQDSVIEVWHEIASILHAPAARLRPSDRFGEDVGAYWITSEELDALGVAAEQRAKREGLSVELASIETVDEYVSKLAARSTGGTGRSENSSNDC